MNKTDLGDALVQVKCPTCGGSDSYVLAQFWDKCPTCKGSGYWLQGVRVKCGGCKNGKVPRSLVPRAGWIDCPSCGGLGFTASTDLAVWTEALRVCRRVINLSIRFYPGGISVDCDVLGDPAERHVGWFQAFRYQEEPQPETDVLLAAIQGALAEVAKLGVNCGR